jgi:hypothetical protein
MEVTRPVYPSLPQLSDATPNAATGVAQASYQSQVPARHSTGFGAGDWQTPAREATEQLRFAIEQTPHGRTVSNEMRLRMMEMMLGNKMEAARPMQSADATVNAFMADQVLGFSALLDDTVPDNRSRYVSAAFRFNAALMELQNLCPIGVRNVTFVREWVGYGQFVPHPTSREFHPGESFLVYVEIENPTVHRVPDGFEVSVAISYEILDDNANVHSRREVGKPSERSLSRKRDYNLGIPGTIPASLAPGQYFLRVSITDLNDASMRFAEEQISFRVVPSTRGDL